MTDGPDYFDVHGLVTVQSNADISIPDWFRVPPSAVDDPDLIVDCGPVTTEVSTHDMTRCGIFYFWGNDESLLIDYGLPVLDITVEIRDLAGTTKINYTPSFERFGSIGTLIKTVLQFKLVQNDHLFVHAGGVQTNGGCALIAGMRNTGKTSTILPLVDGDRTEFMSDDLMILGEDGTAYSYPTEVGLSPYTRSGDIVTYSGGNLREWIIRNQTLSLLVQDVIGIDLTERKPIPESAIAESGAVDQVYIIGSGEGEDRRSISLDRAADKILMTTTELIDPFRIYSLNFYAFYTGYSTADLFERGRDIIQSALGEADCFELRGNDVGSYASLVDTSDTVSDS